MDNLGNLTKILLIEDNPSDARLITEYLSRAGETRFNVTVADTLGSGENLLDQQDFDAVLLDLNLPDSNGLSTIERLHGHAPLVPVIVLTGLDNDAVGIAALKKGAQDYMVKGDADRSTLVRSIRYSIERGQLESQILRSNQSLEESVKLRTQELEAARERVQRSEKLALIGQFSGGIAHDLRNPLGAIKNAAALVNRKITAEPSLENRANIELWLEIIDNEVTNANDVITSLLSHGLSKQLAFSNLQIGDVVQDSLDGFVLNENIVLSISVDPDLPPISGDASQLTRVIQNLAGNAQDAMDSGGRLSITAQQIGEFVEIVITDTGCGIGSENIDRIFEPLFSDKPHGTGLGLAICQEIIDKHDGEISVDSRIGSGTSFTIQIPITIRDDSGLAA